ncbi:MAG: DNA polymerase I [Muribaculaceae bacterium]|nr:DNA polymerase I [Muribaculaceae bacterium]
MEKKLVLVDAYAIIYRAYYALIRAPRTTSKGLNTSAIFGFCNAIDDVIRRESPTHIAVCFDPRGGTFRHDAYPEYKAQRDAQPEDITLSVPYIKDILKARNIRVYEVDGYEADDVAGTIAKAAEREGFTTLMMTSDKDYGQLVSDHTFIYRPSSKGGYELRGPKEVCALYGLKRPEQVIDLLALEGDASDNIPGCPGVGEKTAVKLLSDWETVEGVIANADKIKGSLQTKIKENVDKILFSKFLVTIKTDVPVDIDFNEMTRGDEDTDRLLSIYSELEFRSFIAKIKESQAEIPEQKVETQVEEVPDNNGDMGLFDIVYDEPAPAAQVSSAAETAVITTGLEAAQAVDEAMKSALVGVAVNAIGKAAMTAKFNGLALSIADGRTVYIDFNDATLPHIRRLFSANDTVIASHDVKRDYIILHNLDIPFSVRYFDISVAHYILDPEHRHSLPSIAYAYLNNRMIEDTDKFIELKRGESQPEGARAAFIEAADCVRRLVAPLSEAIEKEGQTSLLNDIEIPFVTVLADMEIEGIRLDKDELSRNHTSLNNRIDEMEAEIFQIAGHKFNVASPLQVGEVLFGEMRIDPKAKRTKTGAFSTTEEILEHHRADHRIVDLILNVRKLRKLLSTYINALPGLVNPRTGKIHTSFNQTVTATGRISSANPNLQNIPIRTDDGREIRRAFVPEAGCTLMSADYSQIELRVIADISGDKNMVEAFLSGHDIHRATAAKIFKEDISAVTDEQRRRAKTANFGIIYGISAFGLSERLHIPRGEAKQLIDGYFETYPGIKAYIDKSVENAREKGYVTTIKGRKRMLPDINSRNAVVRSFAERNAVNAPIQGSAADIIKIAMIRIARDIRALGLRSKMILQVHDELVFNVYPAEMETLRRLVVSNMMEAYKGRVPLEVGVGTGANWLEAH